MSDNEGGLSCAQGSWALALGAGVIAAALLMVVGDWRLIPAIFALVVITIILGALLTWLVCKELSGPGELPLGKLGNRTENPAPTSRQSASAAAEPAREGAEPAPEARPAAAASAAKAEKAGVKPTKELSGEAELSSRKGSWKYDAGGDAAKAAPKPAAKPAPAPEPAAAGYGVSDADAPETLSAAREGGPDDLKMIKGVGPKLEKLLNSMGFYHFDQIAAWTDKEVAWVDQNLEGFKGRVSRDNWVAQARTLAQDGSTGISDNDKKDDV